MKFKASLNITLEPINKSLPQKPLLLFTKTQIYYQKNSNVKWKDDHIINGAFYKLIVNDKDAVRYRYEIKVGNSRILGLRISNINEMKLKWIHGMYRIQKEPISFITLIIAALTLIASIVAIVLQMKCS